MNDALHDLFRKAANSSAAVSPHPFDEDATLAGWLGDLFEAPERNRIESHLADCNHCRGILVAMHHEPVIEPKRAGKWPVIVGAIAALAAMLVITFSLMPQKDRTSQPLTPMAKAEKKDRTSQPLTPMAKAEKLLEAGDWRAAAEEAMNLPTDQLSEAERSQRDRIIEQAVYYLGRKALAVGQANEVRMVHAQAEKAGVVSARIENVRLQASRGSSVESELNRKGRLTDYGFNELGQPNSAKSLTPAAHISDGLRAAVESFPDSIELALNYGQFLLHEGRSADALRLFDGVLARSPKNTNAMMGRGIGLFQLNRLNDAVKEFEKVLLIEPDQADAKFNLAVCRKRVEAR